MKYLKILFVFLSAVLLLASCRKDEPAAGDTPPSPPQVNDELPVLPETYMFTPDTFPRFDGSPAAAPLADALVSGLLSDDVASGADGSGSAGIISPSAFIATSTAFRALADGLCDMIFVSEPYPSLAGDLAGQGFQYDMAPVAADALVFIVSKSNPVNNLTSEQIRDIYTGRLTGWQDAGGLDLDITAFQRNEQAASQVLMEKLVMDWGAMADAPMQTVLSGYSMFSGDLLPTAIKGFDGSVNAIGYTLYNYAANMGMADAYKILSIDGVMPGHGTIASGDYPFVSPYYAAIDRSLPGDDGTRILYNWLLSDGGQDFISSAGYVSLRQSQAQGGMERPEAPQMRWAVSAGSPGTRQPSPPAGQPRLRDGTLSALEPSDAYGTILPYSTAVTMNDGSIHPVKYGFVTLDGGTVITDAVYDNIERAVCSEQSGDTYPAAYRLHLYPAGYSSVFDFNTLQAACADDGSWITPFLYSNIVFRRDVFFCQYDYMEGSFDIDVYDYSGNLLYNILDLPWAESISGNAWPEYLIYGVSEGCGFIQLDDDSYALLDVLTGEIRPTDFTQAGMFSNGLAAVMQENPQGSGGLWGFVDKDLEFAIPPQFSREAVFAGSRAITETPDGAQHVINDKGEILFSAAPGCMIVSNESHGYTVYDLSRQDFIYPRFYTYDFAEIMYPPDALPLGSESVLSYLRQGRILCSTETGNWIFGPEESFLLPDIAGQVIEYCDGFVIFSQLDSGYGISGYGIMTLDGNVILSVPPSRSVAPVYPGGRLHFAVNTDTFSGGLYGIGDDSFVKTEYELFDLNGKSVKKGPGVLSYDRVPGLLSVLGYDRFSWLGSGFDALINIPSMGYSFD